MRRKKTYNKKVRNATATTFNGIKFKSKLEKFTYQCLRVAGIPFQYEQVRFTIIDKFKYPGECIEKKKSKGKNVFVHEEGKTTRESVIRKDARDAWGDPNRKFSIGRK